MANTYQSSYTGPVIDRAGKLPDPTSGNVGQFLKKNDAAGNMIFADATAALFFTNKTVSSEMWAADETYELYPYVATVTCTGVNSTYFPQVIFNLNEALSGYFAPVCESVDNNGIKIWASDVPDDFIIPTLIAIRS